MDKNNELYHYGVLGMKWGIRRYQNEDGSLTSAGERHYQYKSWGTKHNEKKSEKTQRKIDELKKNDGSQEKIDKLEYKKSKYDYRAKRSSELDAREEEYARRVTTSGNIASRLLTGGIVGGKQYQQHLAMLGGQNDPRIITGKKVAATILSMWGRQPLYKAVYIRAGEPSKNKYGQRDPYVKAYYDMANGKVPTDPKQLIKD